MGAIRWISRCGEVVRAQLSRGLSAHELSSAMSVGAACAFFPVPGLATPLCLVMGWSLRLNQAVIQAVNIGTAPLYPVAVFLFHRFGAHLLGAIAHVGAVQGLYGYAGVALAGWLCAAVASMPLIYVVARIVLAARQASLLLMAR